jgi:hypothetical protein
MNGASGNHIANKVRAFMDLKKYNLLDLPKITDPRGNLTFVEGCNHIPFEVRRLYYLYDVPGGADRAGHALKTCHQFLIAMSGSFDVILYDGRDKQRIHLNRSYYGLHIPPMLWRGIGNFYDIPKTADLR